MTDLDEKGMEAAIEAWHAKFIEYTSFHESISAAIRAYEAAKGPGEPAGDETLTDAEISYYLENLEPDADKLHVTAMRKALIELQSIRALYAAPYPSQSLDEVAATCEDCHGPTLTWFAPNKLWNIVKGGPSATDDPGGMLCPNCFIKRAEAAGVVPTAWVLDLEAALSASPQRDGSPTHRHKKRGTEYVLIGVGKMQAEDWYKEIPWGGEDGGQPGYEAADMAEVAIYRSVDDGSLWVRPREEFEEKFMELPR
ncbi:MAG: hypothetical protein WC829_02255 [Hyphomicrobium sp.]